METQLLRWLSHQYLKIPKEIIFSLTTHMTYHVIYTLSFELIIDTILLDKTLKDMRTKQTIFIAEWVSIELRSIIIPLQCLCRNSLNNKGYEENKLDYETWNH